MCVEFVYWFTERVCSRTNPSKRHTYIMLILSFNLWFTRKPLTRNHHHSLLSSINHHFFPCTDNKVNLVWRRNNYSSSVTDRSAECLSSCESMPGFWCVCLCSPSTSLVSPVSRRCWLAIAAGQSSCCLRCAPWASVWRETVTGLSPLALTHLEKKKGCRVSPLHRARAPSSRTESHTVKNKKKIPIVRFCFNGN